jgi:hypothetical protein
LAIWVPSSRLDKENETMLQILSLTKTKRQRAMCAARRSAAAGVAAAAMLLGLGSLANAAVPPQAYCIPELTRLSAEWDAIGFGIPQKPSQQIVNSRVGLTASGPEVTFLRDQFRQAIWDCRHGYVGIAQARAGLIAERLQDLELR